MATVPPTYRKLFLEFIEKQQRYLMNDFCQLYSQKLPSEQFIKQVNEAIAKHNAVVQEYIKEMED